MTGKPPPRSKRVGIGARPPANPHAEAWIRQGDAIALNKGDLYTARLTLDITPALRARIKVSAFTQGVTVADLRQALQSANQGLPVGELLRGNQALALEAGVPPGVLNIVHGHGAHAGKALVEHSDVKSISFTGSTLVGVGAGVFALILVGVLGIGATGARAGGVVSVSSTGCSVPPRRTSRRITLPGRVLVRTYSSNAASFWGA